MYTLNKLNDRLQQVATNQHSLIQRFPGVQYSLLFHIVQYYNFIHINTTLCVCVCVCVLLYIYLCEDQCDAHLQSEVIWKVRTRDEPTQILILKLKYGYDSNYFH